MADRPNVKTRVITRDRLATFLQSPEMIRAFELLFRDVQITLPDAIEAIGVDFNGILAGSMFAPRVPPIQFPAADNESALLAAEAFLHRAPAAAPLVAKGASEVLETAAFMPAPTMPYMPDDATSKVLATQIFGY